jgi:hypothetical protein
MNAIQYFDWGGNTMPLFMSFRFKDYFSIPKTNLIPTFYNSSRKFNSAIEYITENQIGSEYSYFYSKRTSFVQEGNDYIVKIFYDGRLQGDFNKKIKTLVIGRASDLNSPNIGFSIECYGNMILNGRKIRKGNNGMQHNFNFMYSLYDIRIAKNDDYIRYEDNNQLITIADMIGKEIIFEKTGIR